MEDSIFVSIKTFLGYREIDAFDQNFIMNINTALNALTQMGIGPEEGFEITGDTETWTEFLGAGNKMLNQVKTYVAYQVQLLFDPPSSSTHAEAIKNKIAEIEWRLGTHITLQE